MLQFAPDWFDTCQEFMPELKSCRPMLTRAARGIVFRGATATAAAEKIETIGTLSGLLMIAQFLELLDVLGRAPAADYEVLSSRPLEGRRSGESSSDVVAAALEYIVANIHDEPRLSAAAGVAGMSDSTFSRLFQFASGQTFTSMVTRLRLTHACRLLEQSDAPIAQIAHDVGYSNLSNFNRRFRDEYGTTPREYRRAQAERDAVIL